MHPNVQDLALRAARNAMVMAAAAAAAACGGGDGGIAPTADGAAPAAVTTGDAGQPRRTPPAGPSTAAPDDPVPQAPDGSLASAYVVTNIALERGGVVSRINAAGRIAGSYFSGDEAGHLRAFVWVQGRGLIDIGTLGGSSSQVAALNERGQVVGSAALAGDQVSHAFAWTDAGGIVDVGAAVSAGESSAADINDSGRIAGTARLADQSERGFVLAPPGGIALLAPLAGARDSRAWRINDAGQVAGTSGGRDAQGLPVSAGAFWRQADAAPLDMGTLRPPNTSEGFRFVHPRHLNASGQVAGWLSGAFNPQWPFLWSATQPMQDARPPTAPIFSEVAGFNDAGQMAINAEPGSARQARAFLRTAAGGHIDLGSLGGGGTVASGINRHGLIVGASNDAGGQPRAFAWWPSGGMVDLNTRLSKAPAGIRLHRAVAVSDNGSIVAESNVGLVLLGAPSQAPAIGPIVAEEAAAVNTPIDLRAAFADRDPNATHTALWTWDDGTAPSAGQVVQGQGSGTATGRHTFTAAGIYRVTLAITNTSGQSTRVDRTVVIYDSSGGFVAGAGWIQSPPGAYRPAPSVSGQALFGFVSRYPRGAERPAGLTRLEFRTASLRFVSGDYDWMVVTGARAQYQGTGTINGQGRYRFVLTAVDGARLAAGPADRFRIRIWSRDERNERDVVVYDNQVDDGADGTPAEGTEIGGGSIAILDR